MKTHNLLLVLSLLFLVTAATTCEDDSEWVAPKEVHCVISNVTYRHWDNSGEYPQGATDSKVPKEAYMLEIYVATDIAEYDSAFYDGNRELAYVLTNEIITKISIYAFSEEFPEGTDVTSCFSNYPKRVSDNQMWEHTGEGFPIEVVDPVNRMYKALVITPSAGEYRFRVALTLKNGTVLMGDTEPITLY